MPTKYNRKRYISSQRQKHTSWKSINYPRYQQTNPQTGRQFNTETLYLLPDSALLNNHNIFNGGNGSTRNFRCFVLHFLSGNISEKGSCPSGHHPCLCDHFPIISHVLNYAAVALHHNTQYPNTKT